MRAQKKNMSCQLISLLPRHAVVHLDGTGDEQTCRYVCLRGRAFGDDEHRYQLAVCGHVRHLTVSAAPVSDIAWVADAESSLEEIYIDNTSIDNLSPLLTRALHVAIVFNCSLSRATSFCACPLVRYIDLSHNELEETPDVRLCPRLRTLLLNDNRLRALPEWMAHMSLTLLSVANNQIAALPDAFDGAFNLVLVGNPVAPFWPRRDESHWLASGTSV